MARNKEIEDFLLSRKCKRVRLMYTDIHGIPRGKIYSRQAFLDLSAGMKNCCGVFSKDIAGIPVDETEILWRNGANDNTIAPDMDTRCLTPWIDNCAQVMGDVYGADQKPLCIAPRHILKKAIDLLAQKGLEARVGAEIEFYLFDPRGKPLNQGTQAYSLHHLARVRPFMDALASVLEKMGITFETMVQENSPGQVEITLAHDRALAMADKIIYVRNAVKELGLQLGCCPSFMAVPETGLVPSGCHLNVSARDISTRQDAFQVAAPGKVSLTLERFLGGFLAHLEKALPLFLPTINSYKAPLANSFFPIHATWGWDNRSAAARIPEKRVGPCRLENRLPTSDCNPYLAIAGTLVLGCLGLTGPSLTLPDPIEGNGFDQDFAHIDYDFRRALDAFCGYKPLKEILGSEFFRVFYLIKISEYDRFQRHVSDWEKQTIGDVF